MSMNHNKEALRFTLEGGGGKCLCIETNDTALNKEVCISVNNI